MRAKTLWIVLLAALFEMQPRAAASGHGPVFGLATPTNPKGGWSLDLSLMGRNDELGTSTMMRGLLGYGLTENLKISVSAPVVFQQQPMAPARFSAFMPMGGDFEGLVTWRFHRQDKTIGSRFESAVIGGPIIPGPQANTGPLAGIRRAPGFYAGGVTGLASRVHYAWIGAGYQRYLESENTRIPDLISYTAVYGYRPRSWRTEYPHWDWRLFAELTGERAGSLLRAGVPAENQSHQIFLGPSTLGIYKNYAISVGVQFPVYRAVSPIHPRERFRFAVNLAYFF